MTPNIHFSAAWNTVESPIVTMMTEMIGSPIIGRRITIWIAMPNTNMKTSVSGMPSQNGTWNLVSSDPAHPGADQQQFALREVHDLRRLVDQHERHRDHAIERADHEAVDEELDEELGFMRTRYSSFAGLDPAIHRSEEASSCEV